MIDCTEFKKMKQDELQALCRAKGVPLTMQRALIMDALACRKDHPTADLIYEEVKTRAAGMSRTTVYRVLEAFVGYGIAQKIGSTVAKARFDADASRHHHVECVYCKEVADIAHGHPYEIALPPAEESDFVVTGYSIQFRGICPRCRANGGSNPEGGKDE